MTAAVPTVLVTDADRGSAVAVIRSLGRRGWRVIAAGPHPLSAGLYSRHVSGRLCYPDPRRAPGATGVIRPWVWKTRL